MKKNNYPDPAPRPPSSARRWFWFLITAAILLLFFALSRVGRHEKPGSPGTSSDFTWTGVSTHSSVERAPSLPHRPIGPPSLTAEEIVAGKVSQFGRNRWEIVRAIGRRSGKNVPPEVEKFFDAIAGGKWEEIKAQWDVLAPRS